MTQLPPQQPVSGLSLLQRQPVPVKVILVFTCLYLFLVGIGAMSGAFKSMGKGGANELLLMDATPLVSLFIGILATTLVQSSSTTTSVVVALVASSQLSLSQGAFMVMGANIGTTVTNTIVSLGHITRSNEYRRAFAAATVHDFFNVIVLVILFPLEWITEVYWDEGILTVLSHYLVDAFEGVGGGKFASPIKLATGAAVGGLKALCAGNAVALLIVGILLMFSMLISVVKCLKALTMHRIENLFDKVIFKNPRRSLVFGILLTILVQSSSVTTSLAVPLVGAGLLTIQQVFPYTMGANIGTTCTALLAALGAMAANHGDPAAEKAALVGLTVAFHHVLFNVMGVAVVWWFRQVPIKIAEAFAGLALRNRTIPIVYIVVTFYLLPAVIIWLGTKS